MPNNNEIKLIITATGAEQAAKVLADVAKSGAQLGSITASGAKQAEAALTSFGASAKRVFEIFTGINLATVFQQATLAVRDFVVESSKLGREQQLQEATFKAFASSVGVAGDVLAAQIEQVTEGIIDSGDAMKIAMRGLQEGLQPEQIVTLTDAARQLAKSLQVDVVEAYRTLTEAIATGRSRRLAEIGITIDQEAALKKYAAAQRVTVEQLDTEGKAQATYLAVMEKARPVIESNRKINDEFGESMQRLKVAWQDVQETVGVFINDTALVILKWFKDVRSELADMTPTLTKLGEVWSATWKTITVNFEPLKTEVSGLNKLIKDLGLVFAQVGFGISTVFMVTAGAAAGIGSLLDDLGNKRIPDVGKAMETAVAKQKEAFAAWSDGRKALQDLAAGLGDTKTKTDEQAVSVNAGRNALGEYGKQIKALVPDLKALAAEAEKISGAMRGLTDKLAVESMLPQEAEMAGLLNPFKEKLASLDNLLAADRDRLIAWAQGMVEAISNLKTMKAALEEAMVVLRANEETPSSGLLDRMKVWSDLAVKLHEIEAQFKLTGDEEARLQAAILETSKALIFFNETLGASSEDAQRMQARLAALVDELQRLNTFRATAADVAEAWTFVTDGTVQATLALGDYSTEMGKAQQQSVLLGQSLGTRIASEIAVTEQAIRRAAAAFGVESEAVRILQERLAGLKGQAFSESLAAINREAALLGRDFDAAGARLNEFKKRLLELQAIKNPTGEVLAEVGQLKAQFADTQEFIRWRDTFQDIFSSVGRTMNTLVEGFILGTQTIGEAFKKLGQSIIVNFVNAIIQQALNPLAKAAAGVVAGLFSGGGSSTAMAAGVNGGNGGGSGGFGMPSIPTGIFDTGTLSNLWTGATNAVGAFNASLDAGGTIIESVSGAWDSFMVPLSGATSGLTVGLAGVGAAVAAFGTIMDFVNGKTEAAIGGVVGGTVGAVGGALIGSYFPGIGTALGALVGGALGDWLGSMFGGLFGGPSQYALKRAKAADEANAYLGGTTQGYQSALETRSAAQILAALQSTGTGVNPLRTELVLTSNMAAQLGISGQREGDNIIARWTDVNEAQMNELIELFKLNPDIVPGAVRGAGDVGYLPQDKAHEFSAQLEAGAEALLTAFTGLGAVTDKINEVAGDLTAAAQEALPPSLAQEFADGIVNPIRDRMLAVINSGLPVKEMQKQLDTINTELQGKVEAWNMFAVAIKQATVVDALIPADLHEKFRAVMEPAYDEMLNAMRNGTSAQAALQADHFAKQTQAWAAFADAVQAQVGVAMLLEPIADLGDRFSAAMQPVYDKILASLLAGNGTIALAQAQTFAKLTQAWAALGSTVAKSIDVESLLPDDLGDKFRARMQPEYDKILGTLVSGNAEVASALIATFDQQLAAWASMGQTVTRITGELAGLTGNLDGSVEAWVAVQQQMDGAVTRAQAAFDTALAGGNVERIAATAAALHDATLTRLQAELQILEMIKKLEAATQAASAGLADLVTTIATLEVATSGTLRTLDALLGPLEQMATAGATAEQRLWAVQAALKAITAVLPGLIERFATFTTKAEFLAGGMQTTEQFRSGMGAIAPAVLAGALPFLTALEDLIGTASGSGKLALLQQQAEAFQSLAAAAVAAVNQWAQAAITGARDAAAEVIEGARDEAARRIDVARTEAARRQALIDAAREKALAASDAQIEAAQELAEVEQEARRAEIDALQEMISKSKEWEAAVESMGKFIQSLKVGSLGPGNPADKLRQSQDVFAKALAAYNANPTAGGLSDLQGLAQTMLSLAEPIFSKPSPQFQTLSATTLKQLEAAQALAQAQVTDSKVLQAQLDMLIAMDKAATEDAKDQLEALRKNREAVSKDFEKQTKDLSDALEQYLGGIDKDLENYIKAVEAALKTQVTAIENAAKAEVTAINTNLIGALNANAAAQAIAIKDQKDASDALVRALSSTEFGANLGDIATYAAQRQDVAIGILESIRNGISIAVGTPLAQGSERVTEGLYHLHDGEMVFPKAMADKIRSAQDGAGLPEDPRFPGYGIAPTDPSNTGPWAPGSNDPRRDPWITGRPGPAHVWGGPYAEALNALEHTLANAKYAEAVFLRHPNDYKKGGKIFQYMPAAAWAAKKASLHAEVMNIETQLAEMLASIPKTPSTPPPGTPPPGTPPPGTPPPAPDIIPPLPPWMIRPKVGANRGEADMANMGTYSGGAPITVIVKLDGKTIGTATLPTVQADARSGKMRTIILETK